MVAVGVVALPTVAGALPQSAASPAGVLANSQTYQDSTGETPNAPDITTLVVSNTDVGMMSFRINVPNRPTLAQDMIALLFVDTDANPATGGVDFGGSDYVIELFRGEAQLFKWDGTDFTRRFGDPPSVTLSFAYQGGLTLRISANELGNTKKFNFFTIVESGITFDPTTGDPDFTNAIGDVAPGGGNLYPYTVIVAKPTLQVKKTSSTPRAPTAGKLFTFRMTAARSDTGATLRNGRVTCVGRAGTTRLRARVARVVNGQVTCTWMIPAKAKGKTFRGSAAVVFEGLKATRSLSARIR
jgi:hypothetical protein